MTDEYTKVGESLNNKIVTGTNIDLSFFKNTDRQELTEATVRLETMYDAVQNDIQLNFDKVTQLNLKTKPSLAIVHEVAKRLQEVKDVISIRGQVEEIFLNTFDKIALLLEAQQNFIAQIAIEQNRQEEDDDEEQEEASDLQGEESIPTEKLDNPTKKPRK